MKIPRLLPFFCLIAACAVGGGSDDGTLETFLSGTASISLASSSSTVSLATDSEWSLSKTGSLSGSTVTWMVTAAKTATTTGRLLIQGQMKVTNGGSGPATIGNVVVNLQKRVNNNWVTKSSDIANATAGDAATSAKIHKPASSENLGSFSENGASGSLNFMDATNNTIFSLVPQPMIGAGQTRTLLFSAEFDNNAGALQLAPGTPIRAEVIVTFGNATANGNSTANVDINGNGTIDSSEHHVRSVPSRVGLTVPAATNGNTTVTLTDKIGDITATGDVTFSNVHFNLGATSGTVTATVAGGVHGGSITNCAHLTGSDQNANSGGFNFPVVNGVDLQACSSVTVAGSPPVCTPGAPGCGWDPGDMTTASQDSWGDSATSAGAALNANFNALYPGSLVVGGAKTLEFSDAGAVFSYLPASGSPGALTSSILNPLSTSAGTFGGEVTALTLNVDFSSLLGNAVPLGSLTICNLSTLPTMNGQTVAQFLAVAELLLGGDAASISPTQASALAHFVNDAFASGTPSTFAQASLVAGPCN